MIDHLARARPLLDAIAEFIDRSPPGFRSVLATMGEQLIAGVDCLRSRIVALEREAIERETALEHASAEADDLRRRVDSQAKALGFQADRHEAHVAELTARIRELEAAAPFVGGDQLEPFVAANSELRDRIREFEATARAQATARASLVAELDGVRRDLTRARSTVLVLEADVEASRAERVRLEVELAEASQ